MRVLMMLVFLWSTTSIADLIQNKNGDIWSINPKTGEGHFISLAKNYGPFEIISANLLKNKNGDIWVIDPKTGAGTYLNLDKKYAPFNSVR